MWSAPSVLSRCYRLHSLGFRPPFEAGDQIGRGFADVGFEEFSLLDPSTALSLLTGKQSKLKAEDLPHFFLIPSVDLTSAYIYERGYDLIKIEYNDQREWSCCIKGPGGAELECRAQSLQEALLDALIFAYSTTPGFAGFRVVKT